jgi:predicted regulator of Ras-like GTPase activity (Roadblock/LC7/MglB family)
MDPVQAFVNQLASLVGVQGAFIFDSQGTIQQYSTPMKVSLDQGVALARTLSRTLTGLSTVHGSTMMDIDLAYSEGRLVVKGIEQGGLCIICERQLNYSLLNITLEQGLGQLRRSDTQSTNDQSVQIVESLKDIAAEILGEHAPKIFSIIESAGSDEDKLEDAIQQAEKITRMFIDKDQAGKMAGRMRDVVKSK